MLDNRIFVQLIASFIVRLNVGCYLNFGRQFCTRNVVWSQNIYKTTRTPNCEYNLFETFLVGVNVRKIHMRFFYVVVAQK